RWKIENETFNTLKNQGYHFEHNYGHGAQNLATVLALLMLLAFTIDQIQQRCYQLFLSQGNGPCALPSLMRLPSGSSSVRKTRANVSLTTATRGAFSRSRSSINRPARSGTPIARK